MNESFQAVKISEHVYWVGAIDRGIRDFHGYSIDQGTTYNAYLVLGEKVALIDTVKASFKDELLARVASVVDPSRIDYVVSNHAEMDHSGCLPAIVEAVKPEKVFASVMGVKILAEHFDVPAPLVAVKDGGSLSLRNLTLSFTETRMLHWPDSMFSYVREDGVLFSNDVFGMHLASSQRFGDEVGSWEYQAAKYYANILMPMSGLVTKLLAKMAGMDMDLRIVAPDHGPIWRKDLTEIFSLYSGWAARKPSNRALVVYDTMWESTAIMARSIASGLEAGGARVKVMPLKSSERSDIATELLDAGALVVGSPTMNNNLLPTVADSLTYLKGLKPKGLIGAAFGSYGWSGESVAQVRDYLTAMGVDMAREDVRVKFVPREADLDQCVALGSSIAAALREL